MSLIFFSSVSIYICEKSSSLCSFTKRLVHENRVCHQNTLCGKKIRWGWVSDTVWCSSCQGLVDNLTAVAWRIQNQHIYLNGTRIDLSWCLKYIFVPSLGSSILIASCDIQYSWWNGNEAEMILGRNHLILYSILNCKILPSRFGQCCLEQTISLYIIFLNFVFKRLKHFINNFWFWWYVIQQPLAKIFNLLHTHSKDILCLLHVFCSKFLIFCLVFNAILMVSKVLVVILEWDRLESAHQRCYFFVLLILSL